MLFLLADVATHLSMPIPERGGSRGSIVELFKADDVPLELVGDGEVRRIYVRITVGADGKMRACDVTASSGTPRLDSYTCDLIKRRARFSPPSALMARRHIVSFEQT